MNSAATCGTMAFPYPRKSAVRLGEAFASLAAFRYVSARRANTNDKASIGSVNSPQNCPSDFRSHDEQPMFPRARTPRTILRRASLISSAKPRLSEVLSRAASIQSKKSSRSGVSCSWRHIPTGCFSQCACERKSSRKTRIVSPGFELQELA